MSQEKIIRFYRAKYPPDENGQHVFRVALDDETVARLAALANLCHEAPEVVMASIIHDVLKDDEDAHFAPEEEQLIFNQ